MNQPDPTDTSFPDNETSAHRAPMRLRLLGPPAVTLNGQSFTLSRRQARALLYYLAANRRPIPRDQLLYLFWPDTLQDKARRNLTRLLSYLRQALPEDGLVSSPQNVRLDSRLAWCDSRWFEHLCAKGEPAGLMRAVDLYGGPFLHGFSLPSSPEFDLWLSQEQGRYEQLYLSALAQLVEQTAKAGNEASAITYAQRYLAIDDLAEEIHQRLITLYGQTGDRAAAQRQYENCVTILERELGVAPLPETRAAFKNAIREPAKQMASDTIRTAVEPVWATLPTLDLPLVGRAEAWKALTNAFQRYHTGGVIFIAGEPGIGKSRLLQEFATSQADHLTLTGNSHEATRDLPYQPLTQALRLVLTLPSLWTGIQPVWLGEATQILPELSVHFAGLPKPVKVEPAQAQARLFEAIAQIFLGLAEKKPILLCLDDLHWADGATLGWLNYLADRLSGSDLCLLATYRNQEAESLISLREALGRAGSQATIALTGLSAEAIEGLLRQIPEPVPNPYNLAIKLREATAGNPFFTLETIRSLWETDQLAAQPDQLPLPETVQEVIRGRLARLEPIGRQILDAAAVLSPDLQFEVLAQTAGRSEAEALDGMDQLLKHQILVDDPAGPRFQHDLSRMVVYQDLNQWRQRRLHRRAAQALIDFYHREPDTIAAQVARHFELAGEAKQAVDWYVKAADVARSQHANEEAISTLEQAITLLEEIHEDEERTARLHEALADSLVIVGRFQEAELVYQRALDQCPADDRLWRAGLFRKMAVICFQQGLIQESDAFFDLALEALGQEPSDLPAAERWQTWLDIQLSRFEISYYHARSEEMDALVVEFEAVLDRFADPIHRLAYYHTLCMYIYRRDRYWQPLQAVDYAAEALQIAQTLGDVVEIAYQGFLLGFALLFAGEYEKAGLTLNESLAEAESIGHLPVQNQCLVYLAILYRLSGDIEKAQAIQPRCYETAKKVSVPYYMGAAEANQAWLYYLEGQFEPAEASVRKAFKLWKSIPGYPFFWLAHWPLLAMTLTRGALELAISSAVAMLDPVQMRLPDDLTESLERAVRAFEAGESDAARRAMEQALAQARKYCYL